jgi:hypothetical protein
MHPWVYFRIGPEAQDVKEAEDERTRSGKGLRACHLEAVQIAMGGNEVQPGP